MSEWAAKRFWSEAKAVPEDDGFAVHLDDRLVRTPAKSALLLPTEAMAQAIVSEWDAQEGKIDPSTMPVTRSANAAIDKVTPQFEEVVTLIAAYGDSDLLCYRADSPQGLVQRQAEGWNPLLDWANRRFDVSLSARSGVMHVAQPAVTLEKLHDEVAALDPFQLTAFHDLVSLSGSLVIGLAAIRDYAEIAALWDLSRIDEFWQESQWGADEEATEQALMKRDAFLHADKFFRLAA
ncbi:MAG: ATPase [Litoreibacter sp.]|nr:ATPase [Litoreibacter sp.]